MIHVHSSSRPNHDRQMRRFLLFAGSQYYPRGGARDLVGSYDSFVALLAAAHCLRSDSGHDWFQTYDLETGDLVFMTRRGPTASWAETCGGCWAAEKDCMCNILRAERME